MLNFFASGRHFGLAAAIDYHGALGTHTSGCADGVHGCVTAADNCHPLSERSRSVASGTSGTHQIDTCEVFVARKHTAVILAGDTHETGKSGT